MVVFLDMTSVLILLFCATSILGVFINSFKEIPGGSIIMVFIGISCLKIHTFHKSWNSPTLYSIFILVSKSTKLFSNDSVKIYSPERLAPKNLDIQHNR